MFSRSPVICQLQKQGNPVHDDLDHWGGRGHHGSSQSRILLISTSPKDPSIKDITEYLQSMRLKYKMVSVSNVPDLMNVKTKYIVIIFQNIQDLYRMESKTRDMIENFCKTFKVGIVGFLNSGRWKTVNVPLGDSNSTSLTRVSDNLSIRSFSTTSHNSLRILKKNISFKEEYLISSKWVQISSTDERVLPVVKAVYQDGSSGSLVVEDRAGDVSKVVIGGSRSLQFWFLKILFLDLLFYLTRGAISFPLTRYILVDIDDIFVGSARLVPSDVDALVESQNYLQKLVTGFQYNLGFSGKYFKNGNELENAGDELLVRVADKFWWFPHMWKHIQPHRFDNVSELTKRMIWNKQFAQDKGLPVMNRYAVAPHHSGVYPVHEQLYEAWREVWGVRVTSTEEYPNLRPARRRRGFVHAGVSVLPRQTCGLFTKNLLYDQYPGGVDKLEQSIQGGELFMTIITNPINIFMTHMPNYCCDRLAPYTFNFLFNYLRCHTNLNLVTQPPSHLAETYFKLFPDESQAVWGNPCEDKRHLEIWSESKSCQRLPQFLVIGPQKSGSTALHSFLQLHPSVVANRPSKQTFEEIQFFSNTANYAKGIDWYMDFFPPVNNHSSEVVMFEKSATYFDGDQVPLRVSRLLPHSTVVAILIEPGARAYSWYHHMRAHNDPTALTHTFHEILTAGPEASKPLLSLQSRCLEPGKYAVHLEKWLAQVGPDQLVIVDGDQLKHDPVTVMNALQNSLNIAPFFDYSNSLVYDSSKGFYCMRLNGKKKCLGKGKGRQYSEMESPSVTWLSKYYSKHNENLRKLLNKFGYPIPSWFARAEEA